MGCDSDYYTTFDNSRLKCRSCEYLAKDCAYCRNESDGCDRCKDGYFDWFGTCQKEWFT